MMPASSQELSSLWTADSRRSSAGIYGKMKQQMHALDLRESAVHKELSSGIYGKLKQQRDGHAENEVALMIGASMGIVARIAAALPSEGASAVVNCASGKDQAEGGAHVWDQG